MLGYIKLSKTLPIAYVTSRVDTSAAADGSSEAIDIHLNGSATAMAYSPTPTDSGVGKMLVDVVVSTGNGFAVGDRFCVYARATTADSIAVAAPIGDFIVTARDIDDLSFPQTTGRGTLVAADGSVSPNWADVKSQSSTLNLSGTTVKTATDVETDTQDIQARLPTALTGGGNMKADSLAISGDTGAADNVEAAFDGTGYVHDTAPAQMQQVRNIGQGSSAINLIAASRAIVTGTETGTLANTNANDGTYWNIADVAGTLEVTVDFTVSAIAGGVATTLSWLGCVVGVVNTIKVFARNWGGASWDQIGSIVGIAGAVESDEEFELTNAHTSAGIARVRFQATGLVSATLKTDYLLLGVTSVAPTAAAIQSGLATSAAVALIAADIDTLQSDAAAGLVAVLDVIARNAGLLHNNAMDDKRIYNLDGTLASCRKRVFVNSAALAAATEGHADDADNEIARYQMTFAYLAGKLFSFRWNQEL